MLDFPFIFRGALDVRTQNIPEGMKKAAAEALAGLAKEAPSLQFTAMYGDLSFGRDYFIPKPFDRRVIERVAPAVAKAACAEGIAYADGLRQRMNPFWLFWAGSALYKKYPRFLRGYFLGRRLGLRI